VRNTKDRKIRWIVKQHKTSRPTTRSIECRKQQQRRRQQNFLYVVRHESLWLHPRFCSSHKPQNPFGYLRRKDKRHCAKSENWGLRTNLSSTKERKERSGRASTTACKAAEVRNGRPALLCARSLFCFFGCFSGNFSFLFVQLLYSYFLASM
jgi:hypothetical protein